MRNRTSPLDEYLQRVQNEEEKNAKKDPRGQSFHDEVQKAVTGFQIPLMDISKIYRAAEQAFDAGKNVTEAVVGACEALGCTKSNGGTEETEALKENSLTIPSWVIKKCKEYECDSSMMANLKSDVEAYLKHSKAAVGASISLDDAWTEALHDHGIEQNEEEKKKNFDPAQLEKWVEFQYFKADLSEGQIATIISKDAKNRMSYREALEFVEGVVASAH